MNFKTIFACLLFFSVLSSAQLCELLKVRVTGENYVPLGGIDVLVNYQKNDFSFLDAFENAKTGEDGIATLTLCNQVYPNAKTNRSYKVSVQGFGFKDERWTAYGWNIFESKHLEDFKFNITVQAVNVTVSDHSGKAIQGAIVSLNSPYASEKTTNAIGVVSFLLPLGAEANASAFFNEELESVKKIIQANDSIRVTLSFYNASLSASVYDDEGNLLAGIPMRVSYKSVTRSGYTDTRGVLVLGKINALNATVTATYRELNSSKQANLAENNLTSIEFVFKRNPLEIIFANASPSFENSSCDSIRLLANATDPRFEQRELVVKANYSFNESKPRVREKKLRFNESSGLFQADVSCTEKTLPLNFTFKIIAENRLDSKESEFYSHVVSFTPAPEQNASAEQNISQTNASSISSNASANETKPSNATIIINEPAPPSWGGLSNLQFDLKSVLQVVISVVILAIALYFLVALSASLFKRKKVISDDEGEDELEKLRKEVEDEMAQKWQEKKGKIK
ncbi:hypothetical protein HY992_01765 [Candidatus Micrarchaeota archaeon]|nr:hypothetical protein [Candidatus Micrarchaeota archaeon]